VSLLKLTNKQIEELLYYETGFEQLHPIPPIHNWMEEHGWEYHKDWDCKRLVWETQGSMYGLEFRDDEIMGMFILRWL